MTLHEAPPAPAVGPARPVRLGERSGSVTVTMTGDGTSGYRGRVAICDQDGRPLGQGEVSLRSAADLPGGAGHELLHGELVAPLWMLSLGGGVEVRFPDGARRRLQIREIQRMDGPIATARVQTLAMPIDLGSSERPAPA